MADINSLIATVGDYGIGSAFSKGQEEGRIRNALAFASRNYATNPQAAANALLEIGDVRGAQGIMDSVRRTEADAAERAALADYRRQTLGIQQGELDIRRQQEQRLGRPDADIYGQRAAAAGRFGLQEGTPDYQAFVLYGQAPKGAEGAFPGQGSEVAGINEMVRTGKITKDQAARYLAGKTVSGPGGELNFITPTDIFPEAAAPAAPAPVAPAGNQFGPRDPRYAPPLPSPMRTPMPVATAPALPSAPAAAPSAGVQLRAGQPKAPTEGNLNAAGFYARANESDAIISEPEVSAAGQSSLQRGLDYLPGGTYLTSPNYQKLDTAKRNFITAVLRKESGASIAPSEFANEERKYFPQPGEGPQIIAQKAQARRTAIQALKLQAGPAVQQGGGGYVFNQQTGELEEQQ